MKQCLRTLLLLCAFTLVTTQFDGEREEFGNDVVEENYNAHHKMEAQAQVDVETFMTVDGTSDELSAKDSIELLDVPEKSVPTFRVKVKYSVAGARILLMEVFAIATEQSKVILHNEWTETDTHVVDKVQVIKVSLPDALVYKEDKTRNILADLHSEYLLVKVSMLDFHNPSVLLLYMDHTIKLTPPWSRMEKQGRYSCSWKGMILKKFTKNQIPKCPKVDDVVHLLPYTVATIESEEGFKKFFKGIHLPDEFVDDYQNEIPQFTITTWLYFAKPCSKNMCPLFYHIKKFGGSFLTPMLGLLQMGYLHVQVHDSDGNGYAFLFDAQVPIRRWVHLAITFKGTVITLLVRHGRNLENTKLLVHSDFPNGMYHYNDTDGHWAIGGSMGFPSGQGFIGPATIYRRRALPVETIETIFTAKPKPTIAISKYFKTCRDLKTSVRRLLKTKAMQKESCQALPLIPDKTGVKCLAGLAGAASEIVKVSDELWPTEPDQFQDLPNKVYEHAFNMITSDTSNIKDALNFLLYASCLGHKKSMYLTAVLHGTGLGTNLNIARFQTFLLIGALNRHPLSQMSLAYKHLIGVDGFPKDIDLAQVYYRHAAERTNNILNEHNEVDTHSEAVRLDKKEDLENYHDGPKSNWFTWLKHLARQGATDAHNALGEVFYYGARGFRRNLTKAAEYYEMGANQGDALMLFNLGVVTLRGQGVTKNEQEARKLLEKAADMGFAAAFNALGFYELHILGNKTGALYYFKHAAKNGDRDGLFNMGFAYETAMEPGSTPDLERAVPYYIDAANDGHPGGCISAGDAFSRGNYVKRNGHLALIYYKFVADQIPEIGFHLRNGLDEYFAGAWFKCLVNYLLAAEAGMEVAQSNVAFLCEQNPGIAKHTEVDCMWRYYNHSAKLEWVPSMIKTGDNYWYGITVTRNITAATELYSKAAAKDQNPQAIYNLGYLVENNYSLAGLHWREYHATSSGTGNLSLAAIFYRKCRDSSDDALVPCSLGLLRVAVKMAWQFQIANSEVLLIPSIIFLVFIGLLICICRISESDNEVMDIA